MNCYVFNLFIFEIILKAAGTYGSYPGNRFSTESLFKFFY